MPIVEEELLEPFARFVRFNKGVKEIKKGFPITIVDLGCGRKLRFFNFSKSKGVKIKKYIGIDPRAHSIRAKNIKIIKTPIIKQIPLPKNSVDYVVGFAFLEHIDYPEHIIKESLRILKKGGKAIFTTPTSAAKKLLEFLSCKLKLISRREIEEHKTYLDKSITKNISGRVKYSKFEFGLNLFIVIEKI